MKDITIRDLLDMVAADIPDAESRIQRMFEWHFERDTMITKWVLGVAASLFVAVLVAFFKAEVKIPLWQVSIVGTLALASSTYGIYRVVRIRAIHRQFVKALAVYNELKEISAFIRMYRSSD